jgi:hypothetical protein
MDLLHVRLFKIAKTINPKTPAQISPSLMLPACGQEVKLPVHVKGKLVEILIRIHVLHQPMA